MAIRLHVHDRNECIAQVSDVETRALVSTFGEGQVRDPVQQGLARRFLEDLRRRHHWLACSCREDAGEADFAPLLSPRKIGASEYVLCRHDLVGHHPACPFHVAEEDRRLGEGGARAAPRTITPWTRSWLLLRPEATETSPSAAAARPRRTSLPGTRAGPAAPALERLHRTLLERMGFHVLTAAELQGKAQTSAYERFKGIDAEPVSGTLTWGEIACRFPGALTRHCIQLRRRADEFTSGMKPQGYFIGIVDTVEGSATDGWRLGWSNSKGTGEIAFAGDVVGHADREGPFHALVLLASADNDPLVQPRAACMLPCYSRSILMPVESDLARDALHWLTAILREARTLPADLQVQCTLFPSGELEPAFTLAWGERQALVFLDSDPADVLERERELVARARHALAHFVFRASGDNEASRRRLHALLGREARSE